MKAMKYRDALEKQVQNKNFRDEYDALEEEFTVARAVIRLRLEKGWTQKELAEHAHTSQPAIARLESGNYRNLTLSFLRRIGKALDATPVLHMRPAGSESRQRL